MSTPRRISLLALALALAAPPVVYAQEASPKGAPKKAPKKKGDAKKAQLLFEEAEAFYKIGEFASALTNYQNAYLAFSDPSLLFNIAQCYRQMEQYEDAIQAYKTYLRESPETPIRGEVETIITEIEDLVRKREAIRKAELEPVSQPQPESRPIDPGPVVVPVTPGPSVVQRFWLPGALAGAGLAFGGGALLLQSRVVQAGEISQAQARAGLLLAGASDVSLLAAGVTALVIVLRPSTPDEKVSLAPRLAPGLAGASLRVSFP